VQNKFNYYVFYLGKLFLLIISDCFTLLFLKIFIDLSDKHQHRYGHHCQQQHNQNYMFFVEHQSLQQVSFSKYYIMCSQSEVPVYMSIYMY